MANSKKFRSNELVAHVAESLSRWVQPGWHIALGLSGGLDSVVLLDILRRLSLLHHFQLSAIHVNHQISLNAQSWAQFCQTLCQRFDIPLDTSEVILPHSKLGLEANARNARYKVFAEHKADMIVLAHHLDDQSETLLLQLFRGTGIKGLAGMPTYREHQPTANMPRRVLRPLLDVSRRTLEEYANGESLEWVSDESNSDIGYSRNYLRHKVLPIIESHFPQYRQSLSRTSRHMAETIELLQALGEADLSQAMEKQRLQLQRVRHLSYPRIKNLFRHFLARQKLLMPSEARLDQMLEQLFMSRTDSQVSLLHDGVNIVRFKSEIYLVPIVHTPLPGTPLVWNGEAIIDLGSQGKLHLDQQRGMGLSLEKLEQNEVTIGFRQGGERFRPDARRPRRTLKNLLQEAEILPWQRNNMPLLFCGEQLVWVPDIGIDCEFQSISDEPGLLVSWQI